MKTFVRYITILVVIALSIFVFLHDNNVLNSATHHQKNNSYLHQNLSTILNINYKVDSMKNDITNVDFITEKNFHEKILKENLKLQIEDTKHINSILYYVIKIQKKEFFKRN